MARRQRPNRYYARLKGEFIEVIKIHLTTTDNIHTRKKPKVILSGLYNTWINWDRKKEDVKTQDIPFGLEWYKLNENFGNGERICDLWKESPGVCGDFLEDLDYVALADGIRRMRYRPILNQSNVLVFEPYDNKPKEICCKSSRFGYFHPSNYFFTVWTPIAKETYIISKRKEGNIAGEVVDKWQIFHNRNLIGTDNLMQPVKYFGRKHFAEKHGDICSQLADS